MSSAKSFHGISWGSETKLGNVPQNESGGAKEFTTSDSENGNVCETETFACRQKPYQENLVWARHFPEILLISGIEPL